MKQQPEEWSIPASPALAVHVTEAGTRTRRGWQRCQIDDDIQFRTDRLETYCLAQWDEVVYDSFLVAAAVEFGDMSLARSTRSWPRDIELHIPVHDPARWREDRVSSALHDALNVLSGDRWRISFYERCRPVEPPPQGRFAISGDVQAVIPYSDGLDSRCVAGIMQRELRDRLILVRLGSKLAGGKARSRKRHPFTSVPYRVRAGDRGPAESSARSRGFKFAVLSGLVAYLSGATEIVVPESGQGAIGPSLVTVGQGYEDYRSHPIYTQRMERFFDALLGRQIRFRFPRLWHTKAETLKAFVDLQNEESSWVGTKSCWQQSRQVSVDQKQRQCGICAACLLRRMSIHAAGLKDIDSGYVWEDLGAPTFETGTASTFPKAKITTKLREYAIAGSLHLDHLAGLYDSPGNAKMLELSAFQLSRALDEPQEEIRMKLNRLILKHEAEWRSFVSFLGEQSFIANWAVKGRSQ